MKEIKDIIRAFDEAQLKGKRTALATVVHVEGSSYRRPGARMLITEDGELTGAISGGCLEGDALRKAQHVMTQQKSMLVTYDSMDEDDATIGMGLGCNGIIQVLIEPILPKDPGNPIQYLKSIAAERKNAVLVTLVSLKNKRDEQLGTCFLLNHDGSILERLHITLLKKAVAEDANLAFLKHKSSFKNYITESFGITAFIEFVQPAVSLIVVGAGNDVMPVVSIADLLGWETTVIDGRPSYAKAERFTPGCKVLVAKPEQALQQLTIDERTVFVLMTHNYNYDKSMLKELLQRDCVYAGMLGPKKKLERILLEFKEEGVELSNEQLNHIYSPVGLDIGAETPEEIAISIIAEIKAVMEGKYGHMLSTFEEAIHSRDDSYIEVKRLTSL